MLITMVLWGVVDPSMVSFELLTMEWFSGVVIRREEEGVGVVSVEGLSLLSGVRVGMVAGEEEGFWLDLRL